MATYEKKLIYASGSRAGLVLWKPVTFESGKKYPLIVFLHGVGECGTGTNTTGCKSCGLGSLDCYLGTGRDVMVGAQNYGFVLIAPQANCISNNGKGCPSVSPNLYKGDEVDEAYNYLKNNSNYNTKINWDKVYLTGLSYGGGGTNRYLAEHRDAHTRFAAAAGMCPGGNSGFISDPTGYDNIAYNLQYMPLWLHHSYYDSTVQPDASTYALENKLAARGALTNFRKTIWCHQGHATQGWHSYAENSPGKKDCVVKVSCVALNEALTSSNGRPNFYNAAYNIYDWFLLNAVSAAPVNPGSSTQQNTTTTTTTTTTSTTTRTTTTHLATTTTTTTKAPPLPMPTTYNLLSVTISSDVNISRSLVIQANFVNPNDPNDTRSETYRAATGDRIIGTFESLTYKSITIDYAVAPSLVVGPTKVF